MRTLYNVCPVRAPQMSALLERLRVNAAYAYLFVGVIWVGVAALAGSALVLWPAAACLLGGAQLWKWPARRLTWAWAVSTAFLGFLLSAYLVYAWAPFLGGAFSGVASGATGAFVVLALLSLALFYAGLKPPSTAQD